MRRDPSHYATASAAAEAAKDRPTSVFTLTSQPRKMAEPWTDVDKCLRRHEITADADGKGRELKLPAVGAKQQPAGMHGSTVFGSVRVRI